jgi:acyl carrier protein
MPTTTPGVDIAAAVRTFIADNYLYREGADSLADTDSFVERGIIDSMGILELVKYLETTFAIAVADDELVPENFDSIRNVAAYVRRKLGTGG